MGELGEFYGGSTPSSSDPTLWDGDIEWLVPSDLTALPPEQRMILQAGRRITKRGYDSCATRLLPEGAISMCSRATIGDCVILGVPMCTNQGFINIVTNDLVNNRFLLHWIRANKPAILRFSAGTTFDEIGRRTFKRIKLHLPEDPEEQKRIADFLDAFDDLLLARRESVALLSPVRDVLARGLTRGVVSLTQASKDQP